MKLKKSDKVVLIVFAIFIAVILILAFVRLGVNNAEQASEETTSENSENSDESEDDVIVVEPPAECESLTIAAGEGEVMVFEASAPTELSSTCKKLAVFQDDLNQMIVRAAASDAGFETLSYTIPYVGELAEGDLGVEWGTENEAVVADVIVKNNGQTISEQTINYTTHTVTPTAQQ